MARLLIIEDERKVLRSLERGLQAEGYEVATAATGEAGYEQALAHSFDGLVLDLMLPNRDGLQVLAELRRAGKKMPVLVLTARDTVEDRVLGLDSGADDYLVKPFAFAELLARLRALLRRGSGERETILRADDLEMDLLQRRVRRGGQEISLTLREFELLHYLLQHKNAIVTRDMLGRDVWKEPGYALTNVIDVFFTLLRRKIELPGKRPLIQTLRGIGYSLCDPSCA
ncbi:MAG TPA: response regulator transcription factor [Gemmataceae bacterium]|nr:response regulator transcription factor [Gemmataceae bacterium]